MASDSVEYITSTKNPLIQLTRSLLSERSARSEHNLFIVEGLRLAAEVSQSTLIPEYVLFSDRLLPDGMQIVNHYREHGVRVVEVHEGTLDRVSDTKTSQALLLAVPFPRNLIPANPTLVLILDQLRDPGNMGTILRSASAAGVQAVFLTPGCVDPYMPKVVRAGMGAHFHLSIQNAAWNEIQEFCQKNHTTPLKIWLSESAGGTNMWQTDLRTPLALIIGGEADGAGGEAMKIADELIHIPMPGNFESLNAGVAASLLLFEILRQRQV